MTPPQEAAPSPGGEPDVNDEQGEFAPDPHTELLARLRARNAASEVNYRIKSGGVP